MQFFSNREAARLSWKSWQMIKTIGNEKEKAISIRESKLAKSSIPTPDKIKSWYQQLQNILKLSEDLDLNDKGLDTLIAQFSKETQLNKDLDSSDEEEVQEEDPVGPLTSNGRLLNVHIGSLDVQKGRSMDV